ncbi:hypothetical protein BJ165DRAFT_1563943, partial [Panaeolus papilionaceus]
LRPSTLHPAQLHLTKDSSNTFNTLHHCFTTYTTKSTRSSRFYPTLHAATKMPVVRSGTPLPEIISAPNPPAAPAHNAVEVLSEEQLYEIRRQQDLRGPKPRYTYLIDWSNQRSELDALLLRDPHLAAKKRKDKAVAAKKARDRRLAELDREFAEIRQRLRKTLPPVNPIVLAPIARNPQPTNGKRKAKPLARSSTTILDLTATPLDLAPMQSELPRKRAKPLGRTSTIRDLEAPSPSPNTTAPTTSQADHAVTIRRVQPLARSYSSSDFIQPGTQDTSRRRSGRSSRSRPYPKRKHTKPIHLELERTYSFCTIEEHKKVQADKEDEAALQALALRLSPPPEPTPEQLEALKKVPQKFETVRAFYVYRPSYGLWYKVFVREGILYDDPDEEDLRHIFPAGYDERMKEAVTRREYVERSDGYRIRDFIPGVNPFSELKQKEEDMDIDMDTDKDADTVIDDE